MPRTIVQSRRTPGECNWGVHPISRAQAGVNSASLAIRANYVIDVRYSPGINRAGAVYSPCSKCVCKVIQGQAVKDANTAFTDVYTIHVRPPPDPHQGASRATPAEGQSCVGHRQDGFAETFAQTGAKPPHLLLR